MSTLALIIVPPIPDVSVAQYCKSFAEENRNCPIFVAVHGSLPKPTIRKLYQVGVQAIFEWPADKGPLRRTAFRLAGVVGPRSNTASVGADLALEELIREYLNTALPSLGKGIATRVHYRYAILTGKTDTLWKVHVVEQIASQVPGVEEVISRVEVTGPTQTDRAISTAIRQVLKHATEVDPSTLAIRVDDGHVTLAGTATDRHELERAIGLIRNVRGVRSIQNYASPSVKAKEHDRRVAKRVQTAIETHFPKTKIDVAVFGGVAVLAGKVKKASERHAIAELAASQRGVRRVVDNLRVA